jgi:D-3-phosphoglycerate dehydrogenase
MIKGKVLGAALDVLEYEKSSFENLHFGNMPGSMQYLIDSDNVIFSPHIAGWTVESEYKLATFLANKIVQHFVIKK